MTTWKEWKEIEEALTRAERAIQDARALAEQKRIEAATEEIED